MKNSALKIKKNTLSVLAGIIFLISSAHAQQKTFLRVSLDQNKGIHTLRSIRGFYVPSADSSVLLKQGKHVSGINYDQVRHIKIGRSTGHDIFMGTLIGAASGTLIGLISYEKPAPPPPGAWFYFSLDFGPGFAAAVGGVIGTLSGALGGGVHGILKHRSRFIVNSRYESLSRVKIQLNNIPASAGNTSK